MGRFTDHVVAEWRSPFAEAGILDFFLELIASQNTNLKLRSQALRFIGNTCADTGATTFGPGNGGWPITCS